jgi:hypothetical protein
MVKKPLSGSIASLAYTSLVASGCEYSGGGSDWIEAKFFNEYQRGIDFLGEIWKNVLNNYLLVFPIDWNSSSIGFSSIDAQMVQGWILFGDPSLKIGGYNRF